MKFRHAISTIMAFGLATALFGQESAVTLDGKKVGLKFTASEGKARAWASLHSEADLALKGVVVPKGDYTVYILADGAQWQLAVSKATAAKASTYDPKLDLGKVAMTMGKPAAAADGCKIALTKTAVMGAKVEVNWNGTLASAPFHIDRGAADSEW